MGQASFPNQLKRYTRSLRWGGFVAATWLSFPCQAQTAAPLAVGMLKGPESLHPLDAKTPEEQWLVGVLMRPLFFRDAEWNFSCGVCEKIPTFENNLAALKSEGRRQTLNVTWEVSKHAVWGDGTPVSAMDFRLAWEMAKSYPTQSPHTAGFKAIVGLDIDAKNPRKFTVTYGESRHDFLNQGIIYPVPSHAEGGIWKASAGDWSTYRVKTLYKIAAETTGLYNGFYVHGGEKNGRVLALNRRPEKQPTKSTEMLVNQLLIKFAASADGLINDLVAGNVDLIPEGVLDHAAAQKLAAIFKNDASFKAKHRIITAPGMGLELVAFNLRNPILIDRNIRWALAETIDRGAIAKSLLSSDCCGSATLANPRDKIFLKEAFTYSLGGPDTKSAVNRLTASGWKRGGDGTWEKDGKKLQFKIEYTKNHPIRELLVNRLIQDWTRAGFLVTAEAIAPDVFAAETTRKARFSSIAIYGLRLRPGEIPQSVMHSREIPTLQNGYQGQNSMGWSSQVMDSTLTALPWEHDEDTRQEHIETIFKTFINDLPLIPLFFHPLTAIATPRLPGFMLTGHDYPSSTLIPRWNQRPIN